MTIVNFSAYNSKKTYRGVQNGVNKINSCKITIELYSIKQLFSLKLSECINDIGGKLGEISSIILISSTLELKIHNSVASGYFKYWKTEPILNFSHHISETCSVKYLLQEANSCQEKDDFFTCVCNSDG